LPAELKEVYLGFGNDLAARTGEDSWGLPMPGRFVVDGKASPAPSMSIRTTATGPSP
jgi:hypothetical protein